MTERLQFTGSRLNGYPDRAGASIVRFAAAVLMIGIFSFLCNPCSAAGTDDPRYAASVSRRVVRVGMFPRAGHHNYSGEKLVDGYGFDYLQQLRGFAPWEYQYSSRSCPWADMLPMLESGGIDMVSCVLKTPEREEKFAFSKYPVGEAGIILTVKAGNKKFLHRDYAHWSGIRVGLLKDSSWDEYFCGFAKEKGFTFTPVYYLTTEQMLEELQAESKIDAAVTNDFRTIRNEWVYERFGVSQFYIAVRKTDTLLLAELNRALEALNDSRPEFANELRHKYYYESDHNKIAFTAEEKEFIRQMNESGMVFTAILNPDREPISCFTDGSYRGVLKDIADEIIRRSELSIRFIPTRTRREYYCETVENKNIDLIFDFPNNPGRAEDLRFVLSEPYFTTSTSLLHRKDLEKGFKSLVVIDPSNEPNYYNEFFVPGARTIRTGTFKEVIELVSSGNADALYLYTRCAEYAARTDWRGRLAVQFMPAMQNQYCMAVRDSRNPLLFSILNKAAASIDENFINRTYFDHNPPFDSPTTMRKMLVQHPAEVIGGVLAFFVLIFGMLLIALHSRKNVRKEREFLHKILQSVNDGMIVTDRSGNVLRINPIAERMLGQTLEQANRKPVEQIFHALTLDDRTPISLSLRNDLPDTGASELPRNAILDDPDPGRRCFIEYNFSPIRNEKGGVIAGLLSFHDVSGEFRRKETMRREITNWKAVSEIARIYRFVLNRKTRELSGDVPPDFWPVENGIAKRAEDWIVPQDAANWRNRYLELVSGAETQLIATHRVLQNGKMRYFREFMQRDSENPDLITGVIQDVTSVVEIQQKQEAAMLLWQTCIDSVPFMMFVKSARDFRYLQCNDSFARFFNKTPEEVIGKTDAELFNQGELVDKFQESDRRVLSEGVLRTIHESGLDHDGKHRHIMTVKVPAKDLNGEPILICMSADETEEYEQRVALQNLLENRDAVADLAHVASYQMNYKTREISGSKHLGDYWLIRDGKYANASEVVLPEDVEPCVRQYEAIKSGTIAEATVDYRRMKADGVHYYRLNMRKDTSIPDTIAGLMQETTEFVLEQKKSEALHNLWHAVANAIPAILFVKDADDDYRYLYANNNLGILLNRSVQELIGHTEREFIHPSEAMRIRKSDVAAVKSGKTSECYELLRDMNGVDHHFRSIKIPSFNEFGHRIMIQMTTDVTEVQELSEVRKIVSNAFEKLFFAEDLETGIRGVLERVCQFIGFTRGYVCCIDQETNKIRLFTVYIPDGEVSMFNDEKYSIEEAASQAWYQNILESRRGDVFECDFSNPDDCEKAKTLFPQLCERIDKFDIRSTHVQYLEIDGKPWGYVGFIRQYAAPKVLSDNEKTLLNMAANIIELAITRKRTFVNLKNAMDEAKTAAEIKSNFLATMSHEIRTPLNAVLGFADLLKDTRLDEETRKEYLKNIADSGTALLDLINDILDLSKLSANKMVFTPKESSMLDIVSQIGIFFRPKCKAKDLHFIGAVPKNFPLVWIDSQRIRQILFNLIGNAVKFTDEGTITVQTDFIRDTAETGTLSIRVTDTGIGISEEDQEHLFLPFSQANAIRGTATANKGTGLGLAICKQMLECMNGELFVESTVGKGSTFGAVLHEVKYREHTDADSPPVAAVLPKVQLKDCSNLSVLIVDDVPMNLSVLKSILKKLGISAVTASNASDALSQIASRKFDYVLTDLWMPGLNGVEMARKIRQEQKSNSPRIAVITADVEGKDHFDFTVFDGVLTKPITPLAIQTMFSKD